MSEEEDKANEIIKLYQPYNQEYQEGTDMMFNDDIEGAKECALIHVQGIIDSNPTYIDTEDHENEVEQWVVCNKEYYEKVKQIIEQKQ